MSLCASLFHAHGSICEDNVFPTFTGRGYYAHDDDDDDDTHLSVVARRYISRNAATIQSFQRNLSSASVATAAVAAAAVSQTD